ncbi:uncharacterized protein LOC132730368, partial [Ruditapes philippinarum]|uniref:uncharacterized protein LOC132730368 n=1 Tax=Ruditapes philippinarum TaxID=129788 RepID=UPI00295BB99B
MPVMLKNILILCTKRFVQTKLNVTGNGNGVCNSEHIVIGILLFLVLILGVLVSIIGYILMQENNNTLPLLSDMTMNTLSVYCEDLSLSPDDDFDTFEAKKGGMKVSLDNRQNYICSERNLTFFVQKIVERQLRLRQSKGLDSERYLSCGNQSLQRASGDLTVYFSGISHHQTYKESGLDVKIHWDKHEKHSFTDKQRLISHNSPWSRGYTLASLEARGPDFKSQFRLHMFFFFSVAIRFLVLELDVKIHWDKHEKHSFTDKQ